MPAYTLSINGTRHEVEAPADMPLLWVLRDLLGLTGTKYGCGIAQCRSCTVHLDGAPVVSCQVPVSAVGDANIRTIEGLAENGALHVLQRAWIDEDVPQCGYCQSGQLMAAAALLARTPSPTDSDIDTAMDGHICRCGTYNRIKAAIKRAAGDAP